MKKVILVILLLIAICTCGVIAASVTLAWDGNCDTNVTGYIIYHGLVVPPGTTKTKGAYTNDCGVYVPPMTNVYYSYTNGTPIYGRTNTTGVISNLVNGLLYSFTITSFDSSGLESEYANSLTYLVPPPTDTNAPPTAVNGFKILKVEPSI